MRVNEYDPWNWQLVQNGDGFKVYANDYLVCVAWDKNMTYPNGAVKVNGLTINSDYRPNTPNVQAPLNSSPITILQVTQNGEFYTINNSSSFTGWRSGIVIYPRKSALP